MGVGCAGVRLGKKKPEKRRRGEGEEVEDALGGSRGNI